MLPKSNYLFDRLIIQHSCFLIKIEEVRKPLCSNSGPNKALKNKTKKKLLFPFMSLRINEFEVIILVRSHIYI